jgi:uncharacterized protein YfaP (DUF2135 family)
MAHQHLSSRISVLLLLALAIIVTSIGCKKEIQEQKIQGAPGNPRFNLQFTNEANVDLDLYVETPNGSILYYRNQTGQGGTLDVDCLCSDCPTGPNENTFWVDGRPPAGFYKF